MKFRMAAALLSLVGLLIAAYLYLYKIGLIGTMVCGTGACELVQTSRWSRFLGIEVSLIGVLGYIVLFGIGMAGLQPKNLDRTWPDGVMALLSGTALAFSLYLTYLELFVIHAICRWCVASALIILGVFLSSLMGVMSASRGGAVGVSPNRA
ncbi:MAG: vitamin K epoxide reductase family protein [Gemmatimonadota bacterium]